jgi:hypothetical protein
MTHACKAVAVAPIEVCIRGGDAGWQFVSPVPPA